MRDMSYRFLLTLACAGWCFLVACGEGPAQDEAAAVRHPSDFEGPRDVAVLTMEGLGEIRIELLPEVAPGTVQLFSELVDKGSYDGTTFHRVIPGFMIQGGSPSTRKSDPRNHGRGGLADFPGSTGAKIWWFGASLTESICGFGEPQDRSNLVS